jgi:hypothetical protein
MRQNRKFVGFTGMSETLDIDHAPSSRVPSKQIGPDNRSFFSKKQIE